MPKVVRTRSFCEDARKVYKSERCFIKSARKLKQKYGEVDWRTVKLAIERGMQ